jgi:hypothetical protein
VSGEPLHRRLDWVAAQETTTELQRLVGNDNNRRASPVHHRHRIWRHLAESSVELEAHG